MLVGVAILSIAKLTPLISFILFPLTTSFRNELVTAKGHQFCEHALYIYIYLYN
jgi:hypothetical protein